MLGERMDMGQLVWRHMLGERTDTGQLVWRQHARREKQGTGRVSLCGGGGSMLGRENARKENGHGSACVEAARVSLCGGSVLGDRMDTGQLVWRHVRREKRERTTDTGQLVWR